MKTRKLPCGCHCFLGDREMWTEMCAAHTAEAEEISARWRAEHGASMDAFYASPRPAPVTRNTLRVKGVTA